MMISKELLVKDKLKLSFHDKIFCKVKVNGERALIPASNAIDLVLYYKLTEIPSIEELAKLVAAM
jgi:hypothetical protein